MIADTVPLPAAGAPVTEGARRAPAVWCAITLTAAGAAGTAALIHSYQQAEWERGGQFGWFWAGMLVFTLPAAWWAVRASSSARLRVGVLIAYALFTYLPKLLRHPDGPLYHDEYAHWGQSQGILTDGRLFQPNPIVRVIGDYPGLHATVAAFGTLTGLTVWQAALLVLILAHVLLMLGVAALAAHFWSDPRIAATAALIYSLNSSFLFFDTQLGYESLAIAVMVWALVAGVRAMDATGSRARLGWSRLGWSRLGWSALTVLLAGGTTATHHLSAIWLTGVLGLLALTRTVLGGPGRITGWALTAASGLVVTVWLGVVAPTTGRYLDPYLGRALDQFSNLAGGDEEGRELFKQSILPWWERDAAYLAPVIAFLAVAASLMLWWRRRDAFPAAMLLLGGLYFPATLLILTPSGAEGARRSWAFSYLGIALAVAPLVIALIDRFVAARRAAVALFAVLLVGNTAAGMNPSYRFPGPPVFGSDTRAATPEVLAAAAWLRETQGNHLRLVADRYSGLIFGSYGEQAPTTGSVTFPAYDLYRARPGGPMPPALLDQLDRWRFEYLVVDRRMAEQVPDINIYFETNEPLRHDGVPAFDRTQLTKFDHLPWLIKLYDGPHIAVYRFDFATLHSGMTQ
ncbi:hypothetical protein [Actinoplanes sp. NPDC051851]|uniref:hypothetical protein n=1 Tax=Actinoplanes sp. NPDC051851 TaxID=3154753 RepID=UPI003425FA69